MRLYFASKWGTQERVSELACNLVGVVTTSSWLGIPANIDSQQSDVNSRWMFAHTDLADIARADALVLVNGLLGPGDDYGNFEMEYWPTSPGRFLELGYALALGKPVWIIGDKPYSVFYSHPLIRVFADDSDFVQWFNSGRQ